MEETKALQERIERAKELLKTVRHAAVATVNADGSPHNSPVFGAFDDQLCLYWSSHLESHHSQNIDRTGQAFIVLFDSMDKGGGLYIQARANLVPEDELEHALNTFNTRRAELLRGEAPLGKLSSDSTQRLYYAKPVTMWVNMAERDADGNVIRDNRHEISAADLLSSD